MAPVVPLSQVQTSTTSDDSEPYVSGSATRRSDDPRPLPPRFEPVDGTAVSGPIMRRDPLTGDWIPMAAHRMNRTFLPPADANPLGPARPGATYQDGEIPDTDYDVVVFENRFPSLMEVPGVNNAETHPDGQDLFCERPANGRCEVVCFGPDLHTNLVSMGPGRMRTVIEAWADRTAALSALPQIKQVFVFENHGEDIGVTLSHPHGQIYAYPYLTPKTAAMLRQARALGDKTGDPAVNLIASVRDAEVRAGTRVVAENSHWVLYVPVAARWPIEFHLVPRATVATAVRFTLQLLEARAPGQAVEVRVPPFGAVQILPGTTHRRGTPPAVVEMPAEVWLALAVGGLSWSTAISQGLVAASGNRADLGELLPLRI